MKNTIALVMLSCCIFIFGCAESPKTVDDKKILLKKESSQKVKTDKFNKLREQVSEQQKKNDFALAMMTEVSIREISTVNKKDVYDKHCLSCHGSNGNMSISGSKKLSESQMEMTEIVAQVYFGKNAMTPYKDILSNKEIIAVSKYIMNFRK